MFRKADYEKYKAMYAEKGTFTIDLSRRTYAIFGNYGCTVYTRRDSGYGSKYIAGWRFKTCAQANQSLREQRWLDEG